MYRLCQQGECACCGTRQGHNTQQQSGLKQGVAVRNVLASKPYLEPADRLKSPTRSSAFYSMILGVDGM